MSFTAQLRGMALPDILQIISMGKLSGIATIIHEWSSGKIVFNGGQVVYASSDKCGRLGQALVKKKVISETDLNAALATQADQKERMPLATLLVARGLVDSHMLEDHTKQHVKDVFADIITWKEGIFCFEPAPVSEKRAVLRKGLNTAALLIEAAVVSDENEPPTDDTQVDRELCGVGD